MPEIGEVARIVHYIRQNFAGKTLANVTAQVDENVYGKVGCSAAEFEKALKGKKVVDAKQQGKYFWMVMSSPPHPLMHFGMAGWFHIKNLETAYYKPNASKNSAEWPPKYWKFALSTTEGPDECEAAFVDFRRFSRIRLIDCPADEIRNVSPLKENGPDPVQDKDILTEKWLSEKLKSKHVPVKALLLDQANISGIGNWVGDELLYNARIHPEQYSNTLSDAQIKQLHKSIHYVCGFAVEHLADSNKFPEDWLFKHRWGKGKKDKSNVLPNGSKLVYMTVGGRTSCVVPSVQKKTGPVAGDIKGEDLDEDLEVSQGKGKKTGKIKSGKVESEAPVEEKGEIANGNKATRKRKSTTKDEVPVEEERMVENGNKASKKRKSTAEDKPTEVANGRNSADLPTQSGGKKQKSAPATKKDGAQKIIKGEEKADGRRRSTRMSKNDT